jgi:hypothetical protein
MAHRKVPGESGGRRAVGKDKGSPRTGDGRKGGAKPTKAESAVRSKGGAIIWKATAQIFGLGGKKKK